VVITDRGPLLVASWPIVDSLKTQPMRGWLIMGLLLSESRLAQLREQTRLAFEALPPESKLDADDRAALAALESGSEFVLAPRSAELLQAYATIPDIFGAPALLVRTDVPRSVMARGRDTLGFALRSMLAAAVLLLLVLFFLLRSVIMRPLATLTAHVLAVGRSGDLKARVDSRRSDELGVLAREFDEMVGNLARTREELLERAHRDGQSEVAVSVLHNVGNMLNSVNVATSTLAAQVQGGCLADVERLGRTLAEHEKDFVAFVRDDARGQHLPGYLVAFVSGLGAERERMLAEVRTLESGVEHIRALVDSQQAYARTSDEAEQVNLADELEAALRLTPALDGAPEVTVVREFEPVTAVIIGKHRLLEIMVNLIRNARQALRDGGTPGASLRLSLARLPGERVRISVTDNGPGIAPEHLDRLFRQGFTTRADGHGFGLHAAANAAGDLGGTLSAHSDGPGRGASFTLELPLARARKAA
jgi:signal transduction histidine kinase